ncbi:hypothetical protein OAS39_04470 [Pirellulales bacterium]|nr:hypothetical protein [Pirellulales bacterium]
MPIREVGLGRYEANVPLAGRDRASLRLRDAEHDKTRLLHFHRGYPREYRLRQELPPAANQLPRANPHSLTTEVIPTRVRRSIVHWAYFAALGCTLASVLLRRV